MNIVEPIRKIEDIKKMREALKGNLRNELLFIFGINVGLRISDLLNLQFKDLLINKTEIRDSFQVQEIKTKKPKTFYICEVVKNLLKEYIESMNFELTDYVFSGLYPAKPMTRQHAHRIINNAGAKAGLVIKEKRRIIKGELGTHSLRKTFGYHAFKNGTSLTLLMKIFNHSSEAQTLAYIGITNDQMKEVYLGSGLGG